MKKLICLCLLLTACASEPKPKGFVLPPALRETLRGGQLKGLESAESPNLGIPNQYDLIPHTCRSTPIFDLDGNFVRTDVQCW